jgi:hypothetical protein
MVVSKPVQPACGIAQNARSPGGNRHGRGEPSYSALLTSLIRGSAAATKLR